MSWQSNQLNPSGATAGDDKSRAAFISEYASTYSRAFNVYLLEERFVEAFLISEKGRARSFHDSLSTGYFAVIGQ